MHIVLFQPEIPPNTGNVARFCAATATQLHLIEPLGFKLEDRYLKRAGLDYWPNVSLSVWPHFDAYVAEAGQARRMVLTSARSGQALQHYSFTTADSLVFGPETRGLPAELMERFADHVRIPTFDAVRSINLSTAVGIVAYQAFIQTGLADTFAGPSPLVNPGVYRHGA